MLLKDRVKLVAEHVEIVHIYVADLILLFFGLGS